MTPSEPDEVRALWRTQKLQTLEPNVDAMRRAAQLMERKMRRSRIDFVAALVMVSIVVAALAALFRHPLLIAGAGATIAGLTFLAFEVLQHWRHAPAAENGGVASLEYHQALLQHRLEFHRKRLWLRVLTLAPGGLLFFLGFAAARPDLAAIIYVQLATFLAAIMLIVPLNRRAATKLSHEIAALADLREEKSPAS